ncbi:hypothetical protein A3B42_02880 [Candidatus Daviesbacteria bacterium RIFCSPLOWO2_01_FULL_38_10]|uniref:Prepilin-type N-terminal cleavage/methylation domain-containing protein n=1 Tax=Candidatus Daviesbacteria bacterium GW2011_GWF2_38_6 TaxID=1618432 RepID=A0A0G0NHD3_9BACT|nr:MAG: hypothetical protein US80_C0004G0040 [Candidatus Daviesbacteria bacterium GW2011_GWA2_38_17]KKQ76516.1 MAG: hypothetical protein US99_C0070G0018 [Candidatus Daviesbacteria bacterium GW2011_GWF2_38_6]OGE26974.1 MAG: hypothetical protein A3D02_01270 [Candidatus Daviesbacteria bacterium RIFCSPHIGHO2_02_FULL_39_41]OGE37951.1 MAG: hypothetical protein A3B42_02880 [Candidatus Daviesbacteria bacterium RIFCSPLOWO2_01_FULL_38_10]OGE44049.1 MAG: hypothetical protein A3E67_01330 [Candidatus Davies
MVSFPWEKSIKINSSRGVTLIELLLVVAVIGVAVFLMANLPNAMGLVNKSRHLSLAKEIAAKEIEDKRNISYINLVPDTTEIIDSRISLLPSGNGQVVVADCDPLICTNLENIKQVAVTVQWKEGSKDQQVSLKTFIGEGGINQ